MGPRLSKELATAFQVLGISSAGIINSTNTSSINKTISTNIISYINLTIFFNVADFISGTTSINKTISTNVFNSTNLISIVNLTEFTNITSSINQTISTNIINSTYLTDPFNLTNSTNYTNRTKEYAEETQCYALPYGGTGFATHILTFYTIIILWYGRRPSCLRDIFMNSKMERNKAPGSREL